MSELVLEGVTKRYAGVVALNNVYLRVAMGEIVGLIGPNGSGKTTLLNVASGVIKPTAGKVIVDGATTTNKRAHAFAARGVGRTFQQIRLFTDMTVSENVLVGALARHQKSARVAEQLEGLGLTRYASRLATTLAYGDQRRVEIARALAGMPRFLLLDEPAAGMNEVESDQLLDTIRSVRERQGCGVLLVDHDLRLIMRLCDRIHVLAEGITICVGPPEVVRADPKVIEAYLGTAASQS